MPGDCAGHYQRHGEYRGYSVSTQLITPNPNIPAEEGMCLQYVRQSYGLPLRYGSATEAWNNSPSRHTDRNFPQGVWFPVHYGLASNVNGHIVNVAPDGTVWSTSDLDPNPVHHHPSLADLEAYYAHYGVPLTYRGWTEDVAGFPVISVDNSINFNSTTPEEDMELTDAQYERIGKVTAAFVMTDPHGGNTLGELVAENRTQYTNLLTHMDDRATAIVNAIFNTTIPNATGGSTTLGALIGWNDSHVNSIIDAAKSGGTDPVAVQKAVSAALASGVHVNITTN